MRQLSHRQKALKEPVAATVCVGMAWQCFGTALLERLLERGYIGANGAACDAIFAVYLVVVLSSAWYLTCYLLYIVTCASVC